MFSFELFFFNYYFIYIYLYIYLYILYTEIFFKHNKIKFFKIKTKKIDWIDIWNIDTKISKLENHDSNSWNLYYKYKLSMITSWHILEERFLIFFLIILICFF